MTESSNPLRPAVVLVRPQQQGNVGAVARAMANMGLEQLVLVEPAVPLGDTARAFAVHAGQVLDAARRCASLQEALAPYRRVVGTTSSRERTTVELLTARQLGTCLEQEASDTRVALVFGPETSGLTREELALCDPLVRIPCDARQPTLNLGQAVLIVAYELSQHRLLCGERVADPRVLADEEPPAKAAELEGMLDHARDTLAQVGFARDESFDGVLRDLRQLAARSRMNSREVRIVRGICRRTVNRLKRNA